MREQKIVMVTQKTLDNNAHISNEEIARDIAETNKEIENMEIAIKGHKLIASASQDALSRMAHFRVDGNQAGVDKRKEFVVFLEALVKARKE
jgi:hypothetical protein